MRQLHMTRRERIDRERTDRVAHLETLMRGILWGSLAALILVTSWLYW